MAQRPGTRSALLVIDVQVGVVSRAWDRDRIVGNMALAVRRAREAGAAVIWVQHEDDELRRDTPDWALVPELQPGAGELRVHKRHNSAFEETDLLRELDRLTVSRVVVAGAATPWCIRATAYGALERGFDVTLLSDAHTTSDMAPEPGRTVPARSMIDDLNGVMRWLSYPGRTSASVPVAEVRWI